MTTPSRVCVANRPGRAQPVNRVLDNLRPAHQARAQRPRARHACQFLGLSRVQIANPKRHDRPPLSLSAVINARLKEKLQQLAGCATKIAYEEIMVWLSGNRDG